ncbi:LLM class flavin-dependent oxidoreductase [Candidatus Bathyarchaeota archaeon]|nr:LLM class flavin-dependent oxidoreductase [Candidatus Bathyarchaeota archaeon]MBT4319283.1 LLM class flavin-dependent oxidoreductase [Candidatus Bathyarchaeota archaeon]MBT4422895.1 LLM class flavin-dependent oxidoreductase [Candidatus Bathyarchaeota archaeon]MBT5643449.1 LLM class flavin-dependent oxidoreductase [Candidatus Bathyarchaeota archaeon]MBT6603867.1 LLM class flavin-dependent oxidoreductase [Candidatus Bathyarchaeota archaeon]
MDFGVFIRGAVTYDKMLELSLGAEELDYYGVFLNDHVNGFADGGKEPYLEAWTAITALGVHTSKIKVGHITLFNSVRNPAYLAKSATALDVMTKGRFELILGAGWAEQEYLGYDLMEKGRGMPSAAQRVTRLKEAVQIMRGMFDNPVFSYEGRYWKLKEAINVPRPVTKHMKISVGARQPRIIRIAAKYADGINSSGNLANIERIMGIYHTAIEKYGKTIDDVFIHGFAPSVWLFDTQKAYDSYLQKQKADGKDAKSISENDFVGTPEVLIEKWRKAMDLGMTMSVINVKPFADIPSNIEMLAKFKDEVASQL